MIYDLVLGDIINNTFKSDVIHLYGEGSEIKVNHFKYSTNASKFIIDCTLLVNQVDDTIDNYPYGLHLIIEESLKCIVFTEPYVISSSIDVKP